MSRLIVAVLAASLVLLPGAAFAAKKSTGEKSPAQSEGVEPSRPFVTVNGVAIPELEARIVVSDRRNAGVADSPALQNAVRNQLVARELLAQQARRQGMDKDPLLLARQRMAREELLARAYEQDYLIKHAPTEEQVRKEYDTVKARSGDKEFHVRQILLATEDEAKGVIARLRAGEGFQGLASLSRDESGRGRGGDLGWLAPGNLLPQFADVVPKLAKGQYTQQPVKSPSGWHVLLVEDQRPFTMPPYDAKVQGQIRQALGRQALSAHVTELLKAAKVE